MASVEPSGFCPYCGSTNPPDYSFCVTCHRRLPGSGTETSSSIPSTPKQAFDSSSFVAPPPDRYRLVTDDPAANRLDVGRGVAGLFFIYIGIPLLLVGIGLLAFAGPVHDAAATANQACSPMYPCAAPPDFSGAMYAGGALLLIMALGLVGYGIYSYANRDN